MGRGPLLRLGDMARITDKAIRRLSPHDKFSFEADEDLYDASLYAILVVAEAASKLPAPLLARYPDVDWPELIGMGNRLKHQHFRVEADIAWKTLRFDFPVLLALTRKMIADLEAASEAAE